MRSLNFLRIRSDILVAGLAELGLDEVDGGRSKRKMLDEVIATHFVCASRRQTIAFTLPQPRGITYDQLAHLELYSVLHIERSFDWRAFEMAFRSAALSAAPFMTLPAGDGSGCKPMRPQDLSATLCRCLQVYFESVCCTPRPPRG